MEEVLENRVVTFKCGKFEFQKNGILCFSPSIPKLALSDYVEIIETLRPMLNGKKVLYLVDERGRYEPMESESKQYIKESLQEMVTAMAVIENSGAMRFLVHSFVRMYKPKIPMKMFKIKSEAETWLLEH